MSWWLCVRPGIDRKADRFRFEETGWDRLVYPLIGSAAYSDGLRGSGGTQPRFHDIVIDHSSLLPDEFAGREDGEVGNAAHREPCCKLLMLIRVDFENNGLTGHILCGARDLGCSCATRATPISPEVDEDGNTGTLDDFVKECSVDLHGFVEGP